MAVEQLGQAFVEIIPDTKGFGKDAAKGIEGELGPAMDNVNSKISSGMASAFKAVGVAVAGVGVAKFFKDSIGAATDLNEQVSKAGVVFGDSAGKVLDFGKNAATSIGTSNRAAVEAAGTFGNLLKSTGIAADKAADMSVNMVQLAGDLASFNNVPTDQALEAIRAGLVGETEPLKKFGVNLNEATLKQEAMSLGLSDGKGILDANSKAQAAYALILGQTGDAQGDYVRTADSLANRQRTLSALFEDTKATVGQALLPVMKEFVGIATDLVPVVTNVAVSIANIGAAAGQVIAPVAGLLGKMAGTEGGQFVITAGLAAVAIEKIGIVSVTTEGSLGALKAAFAALNPEVVALGAFIGVVVQEYGRQQAAAAESKVRQAELMKAFDDQAPLAAMNKRFGELVATLAKVQGAGQDAGQAVTDAASAMQVAASLTEGDRKALEKYHITTQDIADAINQGGPAWDALRQRISDTTDKYKMQMVAGRDWIDAEHKANDVIDQTISSQQQATAAREAAAEVNVKAAVSAGLLTQAWVDGQQAAEAGVGTEQKWLDIQAAAEPILKKKQEAIKAAADAQQAQADGETVWSTAVTDARGRAADADKKAMASAADLAVQYGLGQDQAEQLASATGLQEDASKRRTDAEKALKDALDKVTESQSQYLFVVGGAQATQDDATRATRDFVKTLTEGTDVVGRGTTALQGNSDAAINNRDSLQALRERAVDVIQGFDKLGYSADQAAAGQQQLAQDMYNTAIQAGATSDEADAVRDSILGIPIKHDTDIKAQADVDQANADLDYAAREREAIIRASLQAVGVSPQLLSAVTGLPASAFGAAKGAMIAPRPGGSLLLAGEAGQPEAVVPLTPAFQRGLNVIANLGTAPGGTSSSQANIVVNIHGAGLDTPTDARSLGRIVGETAAQVLAQRQLATSVRVG